MTIRARSSRVRIARLGHRRGLTGSGPAASRRRPARAWIAIHPPPLLELVAHELRTPVTSLYGATHLLRDRALSSTVRGDLLDAMADDAARLVRLWDPLESTCRHASLSIL